VGVAVGEVAVVVVLVAAVVGTGVWAVVVLVVGVISAMPAVGEAVGETTATTVLPAEGVDTLAAEVGAGPSFDRVHAAVPTRATKRTPVVTMLSHLRIACLL
jgi:hypothetical protein